MFVALLKFADEKAKAKDFMEAHNAWLRQGFDDGVFLLAGSLKPGPDQAGGGAILAHSIDKEALQARLNEDPFVMHRVVETDILEIAPSKAGAQMQFLLG